MADVLNTFSSLSTDAPNVMITRRMFSLAERHLALGQFAQEYTLDSYMGKTMRINRYRRFNLPTQQLVEGQPPDSNGLVLDNVDVTVEQWGIVSRLSDVSIDTLNHPVLSLAIERCGLAIAELVEREQAKVLMTCTNVVYPGAATSRTTITDGVANASMRISTSIFLQCTVQLSARGAAPWENGLYGAVLQPQHIGDLVQSDTTFQQAAVFNRVKKLEYAYVGQWMDTDVVRGNFLPFMVGVTQVSTAAATATKPQVTIADSGGSLTRGSSNGQIYVSMVAREITSDYERRFNVPSAALTLGSGVTTGAITVATPTSANYVYDVYMSAIGDSAAGTMYKVRSRIPASTTVVITSAAAGTEEQLAAANVPANGVSVFPGWVFGKDAFARVKLNGMSMQSYLSPAGATVTDPLAQIRTCGSKFMMKTAIQDQNFLIRFEVSSGFPNYLAA